MGGLLCKQRRGQSPESQGKKKRKKPRGECFLRAPCMLCFIVHNSQRPHPDSCPASPEPPAARLLLLCPGELNAWEERGRGLLCAGLLRGPALLCPVSSQQPPMACKRKNSGDCQQPRHPCKLPRSASAEEETCGPSSPGHLDNCTPPPEHQECCTQHGAPQDHHAPSMPTPHPEEEIEPFHLHQLPPSLLLKIFANLTLNERCLTASLVCKYWRDLCLDFQFWWQLDLSGRQQVKDDVLEKIASRYPNLTEINISDCLNVSDAGICKLAQNCPGLVKYTAYRCKQLSDTSLLSVASQCPCLQKVHVGNQDRLSDEVLKQLGTKCRELKDIHFGQCYKISDEGLIPIAKGSPKLQRIYMQENKLEPQETRRIRTFMLYRTDQPLESSLCQLRAFTLDRRERKVSMWHVFWFPEDDDNNNNKAAWIHKSNILTYLAFLLLQLTFSNLFVVDYTKTYKIFIFLLVFGCITL